MVPYDRKPTSLIQGAVGSISSFREAGSDSNIDLATVDAFGEEWTKFQSFDERELARVGSRNSRTQSGHSPGKTKAPQVQKTLRRFLLGSGRYWTRTSDPYDVNVVLYQLS